MKYVPSIAFEDLSGSAKGVTAAKSRGRRYIRNKGSRGTAASSASQSAVKAIFKQLASSWKLLTDAQIQAWNNLAQTQSGKSTLGTNSKISGANLFMRLNYWVVFCGGTALVNPPRLKGVEAPAAATFTFSDSQYLFKLNSLPKTDASELKLIIQASAPQSNGISSAYDKACTVSGPVNPSITDVDIFTDYTSKNVAASESLPKIFFKWFLVNTTTGEISGVQMECVKPTFADEAGNEEEPVNG